jgi:hypothetical protein
VKHYKQTTQNVFLTHDDKLVDKYPLTHSDIHNIIKDNEPKIKYDMKMIL